MEKQFSIIRAVDHLLTFINSFMLILVLGALIVVSFTQVILRNFFDSGIMWADVGARHLVLWIGFIGALFATRKETHISIDALARAFPESWHEFTRTVVNLISTIVSGFLTFASVKFVIDERLMGGMLFLNIPTWVAELIIPISFAAITLRFCLCFIVHFARMFRQLRGA
ncbi:TRAP transporter small permease subunit [bacterium]|nr:TRAP transporter small permease subunit [bacterium]